MNETISLCIILAWLVLMFAVHTPTRAKRLSGKGKGK